MVLLLGGPEQPGRPVSRGYLHSPSPSLRTQDVVVQQRPSIFQGKSVITSLMYASFLFDLSVFHEHLLLQTSSSHQNIAL